MDHYFPRDSQPGCYSDIGRKARDLLFEDFPVCSKFRLDKHPFSAYLTHQNDLLAISPNDIFLGEGRFSWSVKSVTNEFTIRTNSTLAFKSTINQIAFRVLPGLSAVSEFDTAIANSGKLQVQFMHDYASFKASIGGLFHDTNIGVSSVIGTKNLSLGLDLLLHTNNLNVTKFDGAFAYTTAERRTSSIAMNEMAHVLVASYHQLVNSDTSFGAQFRYSFIDQVPVLTLGVEHRLDPHLWLKARADNTGQVSAIFQWYFMRVLGEFRPAYLPRIGLGIALSF
ncbi:mitochondrial outer membrane protein porin of 34 kDa [Brassica napus]|uniref:Uncharacterized protein n=1 Tax=Brassica oleracea var. oleracea TaxID=109376 RepID=A0A0D3D1Z0_BRAOL|nr:PREDICTED: mitochondrial outer membrane protein porin of 34 kDa-like [Brassica oleracea var. oleracea]XP_013727028.1 mitochondrial outer membrane protein porin of 34 kDa [Brassica napus]XP_013727029.1 mitochondrial outer membrane protein porin of 34 kDa [Brassica napus]XP_048617601.1 mitochondrial outer membrane protein porin of 34 kDa [Brassica napus]